MKELCKASRPIPFFYTSSRRLLEAIRQEINKRYPGSPTKIQLKWWPKRQIINVSIPRFYKGKQQAEHRREYNVSTRNIESVVQLVDELETTVPV